MIGTPAILNTLRFIDTSNLNAGFDGNYYRNQLADFQIGKCYAQKLKKSDVLTLQIITNGDVPSDLDFYDRTGLKAVSIPWQLNPLVITGQPDLKIYEIIYSLATFPTGNFVAQFDQFTTETLNIEQEQPNTVLLKYKNFDNNYDVVFDTGIEFYFRAESWVEYETTENDRNVYIDQVHNYTQLSSVAFRKHNFYVGYKFGVPNWVLDKIVHIQQCDQISYDGIFYQVATDEQFEYEKNQENNYIGGRITIYPSENNFTKYRTQPGESGATFTPVQKTTPYSNIIAPLTVNGLFKNASILEYVVIYKSNADFILNIGITPGGSEIGSFNINQAENSNEVMYVFLNATAVYFSGDGIDIDKLYLVWKQLDELPVPISGGTTAPPVPKNAKILYEELEAGEFVLDFDITTGIGNPNRGWKDWVIAGTNGTLDMGNKFPIGWDRVDTATIGTDKGSNTKTIAKDNLPAEGLDIRVSQAAGGAWRTSNGSGRPITNVGGVGYSDPIQTGKTANMGSGTSLDITPLSLVSVYVIKIV